MALDFIKKVFTFGRSKTAEEAPQADDDRLASEAEEAGGLPLASDPVLPEEMDTAGGPADDEEMDFEAITAAQADPALLPPIEAIGDLGMIPLSLLEAEAEAGTQEAPLDPETMDMAEPDLTGEPPATAEAPALHPEHAPFTSMPAPVELAPDADLENPVEQASSKDSDNAPTLLDAEIADTTETTAEAEISASDEAIEGLTGSPILPKGFAARADTVEEIVAVQQKRNWFQRLRDGLSRTSSQLSGQITALFTKRKLDDDTLQDLEDLLIQADLGMETALRITDTLASERYGRDVRGEDV